MTWADAAIAELRAGRPTTVRPVGRSMEGRVASGSLVYLEPCHDAWNMVNVDDIVLTRLGGFSGRVYLHLVLKKEDGLFLIGNNRGGTNGWVRPVAIYGKAVRIEAP